MRPREIENFREALLKILDANHTRFGLQLPALVMLARTFGFTASESEAEDQMDYLVEKGKAATVEKEMNRALRAWKITEAGRQYLDEHNL